MHQLFLHTYMVQQIKMVCQAGVIFGNPIYFEDESDYENRQLLLIK
ncbi:hypothetical protein KHA80_00080 [Anaerobacillus sp. HL2]|nr:hypothetical protein KHA80_00080 [Anaerobacillus sp. HL2]